MSVAVRTDHEFRDELSEANPNQILWESSNSGDF
jgi:hypothetical protein